MSSAYDAVVKTPIDAYTRPSVPSPSAPGGTPPNAKSMAARPVTSPAIPASARRTVGTGPVRSASRPPTSAPTAMSPAAGARKNDPRCAARHPGRSGRARQAPRRTRRPHRRGGRSRDRATSRGCARRTDERHGYLRVRACAQARCVENHVFVVTAGCTGNLPDVDNADVHYAQSGIFTPCDPSFARDGVAAECQPNVETIVMHDVDIEALRRHRYGGTTQNWNDRRRDLYRVSYTPQDDEPIEEV